LRAVTTPGTFTSVPSVVSRLTGIESGWTTAQHRLRLPAGFEMKKVER
jgi:hypothetical protein